MEQTEYNGYHYQRNNANKWVKEQYAKYVSMLITTIRLDENNTTKLGIKYEMYGGSQAMNKIKTFMVK